MFGLGYGVRVIAYEPTNIFVFRRIPNSIRVPFFGEIQKQFVTRFKY